MARKPGTAVATTAHADSLDKLTARAVSKIAPLVPPWVVPPVAAAAAELFHHLWGGGGTAGAFAAAGLTAGSLGLAGLTWLVSHERGMIGRLHTTVTTIAGGVWVTAATITGPGQRVTLALAILGGSTLALSWNIRHVIRQHQGEGGAPRDALADLFGRTRELHGLEARTRRAGEHKVEGAVALPAGEKTADDIAKRSEYIEGAMGLPPGALTFAADHDRADRAQVTVSDPRAMRQPILYPGPSRPGASIAEPLRIGLWQDFDPAEYVMPGHHLQVMGMTGSAKSFGGCFNILGEAITRKDVAVFGADITKGEQTLGPLRPALHRFETTKAGVKKMISELNEQVSGRTSYLAARGLAKWKPGCGLLYWIIWLEECPRIFDAINMEEYLSLVLALRSGGGSLVNSLQRADYTQMPTIARGQLAKMCFGVDSADDADFGLTDLQAKRHARPELWQNGQPGMAYLDAPTIPDDRKAMPLRAYAWGASDEDYIPAMAEHAARYPAAARPADEFTRRVMTPGGCVLAVTGAAPAAVPAAAAAAQLAAGQDDDGGDSGRDDPAVREVIGEYLATEDPNPANQAGPDDAIDDTGYADWEFTPQPRPAVELDAAGARAELEAQIREWADDGRETFATKDLRPLMDRIGRGRSWVQKEYPALAEAGLISEYDETTGGYRILVPATV